MLCVVSGIIAIVITGFTAWHLSLAMRGMTTIECLEKTRYLSPVKNHMRNLKQANGNGGAMGLQDYRQQLAEIHANALPGVTREEEGEVMLRNGQAGPEFEYTASDSLRQNYAVLERLRERDRYEEYLDEKDSEKLPRAFDLGWRRNLKHLFGERRLYWVLPVCNTTGDGWHWEPSQEWVEARQRVQREREAQAREDQAFEADQDQFAQRGRFEDKVNSQRRYLSPDGSPSSRMSMQTLRRRSSFDENGGDSDVSSDEEPPSFQSRSRVGGVSKYD